MNTATYVSNRMASLTKDLLSERTLSHTYWAKYRSIHFTKCLQGTTHDHSSGACRATSLSSGSVCLCANKICCLWITVEANASFKFSWKLSILLERTPHSCSYIINQHGETATLATWVRLQWYFPQWWRKNLSTSRFPHPYCGFGTNWVWHWPVKNEPWRRTLKH